MTSTTLTFVILVTVATISSGQDTEEMGWKVMSMPDPITRPIACGRNVASFVCDPENLLPEGIADEIDDDLQTIYNKSKVPCYTTGPEVSKRQGYLVMLAVVPKMAKYFTQRTKEDSMHTRYREARSFAYHLGSNSDLWGKHSSNCKGMVIILFSKKDNVLYTSTQPMARQVLQDNMIRGVTMNTLIRYFPFTENNRKAANAIRFMVSRYKMVLAPNKESAKN